MESAKEKLEASNVSQINTVKTHLTSDCVKGCSGQWLQCAKEVLLLNGIYTFQFVTSIKDLLIHGRNRNLIITGPANRAKTIMLKPLKLFFSNSIFGNPANDKYAWPGSEKGVVFLLNDFRLSKDLIPWHDVLLLLEGEAVKPLAPKNIYSEVILISIDVAIFATSKIMTVAINFLHKSKRILPPCPRCFAKLVFFD